MDGLLDKLSSAQILAAIAIVVGGVVALTMILSISRYQLRALEDETTLRREQQQGDLALRTKIVDHGISNGATDLDRLLAEIPEPAPAPVPANVAATNIRLATLFGSLEGDAAEIEAALRLALAANPARRQEIVAVLDELLGVGADAEHALAAIRPLCIVEKSPTLTEI